MVVVMNFEHHLDGATNITVLTDHQTLKGCLTPSLNERQTHRLISFYPTIFIISLKRSIEPISILDDQTIKLGQRCWYLENLISLTWVFRVCMEGNRISFTCRISMTRDEWMTPPDEKLACGRHMVLPEGHSCYVPQYHSSSQRELTCLNDIWIYHAVLIFYYYYYFLREGLSLPLLFFFLLFGYTITLPRYENESSIWKLWGHYGHGEFELSLVYSRCE